MLLVFYGIEPQDVRYLADCSSTVAHIQYIEPFFLNVLEIICILGIGGKKKTKLEFFFLPTLHKYSAFLKSLLLVRNTSLHISEDCSCQCFAQNGTSTLPRVQLKSLVECIYNILYSSIVHTLHIGSLYNFGIKV